VRHAQGIFLNENAITLIAELQHTSRL